MPQELRRTGCFPDNARPHAGKTTFLNVLAGKAEYGVMSGEVTFNGTPLHPRELKRLNGFVPQDDIVHEDLTVEENIKLANALQSTMTQYRQGKDNICNEVRPGCSCVCCERAGVLAA